jgi:flap endonuclease-1
MGLALTPIIVKQPLTLEDLRGKRLAVDTNGELYQFLALIRLRDGSALHDSKGRITSHLSGLFYRTTRLIADYGMQLIFVFDGKPPVLKAAELERRRSIKTRYDAEHAAALASGDFVKAYSKATMTSRLTREMASEAQDLLRLMGLPVVQAPGEGEAQASHIAASGNAWAAGSKDYDCLLFGAPRLLRFLTISGKEFLPSKGVSRAITPELIETAQLLAQHNISREQLVDLAILIGTDFNAGVKGIGPKKALKLVSEYGAIENMPADFQEALGSAVPEIRRLFLQPNVTDNYDVVFNEPDRAGILHMLCDEREFSKDRVGAALDRAFD